MERTTYNGKRVVVFLGSGAGKPGEQMYDEMEKAARILSGVGFAVATGAFSGSGMEAPLKGAGGGIGYTLNSKPGNKFVTQLVDCALGKPIEISFTDRLGKLMFASTAFVMGGDGNMGTFAELTALLNLMTKGFKKGKIVILHPDGVSLEKSVTGLRNYLVEQGMIPEDFVPVVKTAEEAAALAMSAMTGIKED